MLIVAQMGNSRNSNVNLDGVGVVRLVAEVLAGRAHVFDQVPVSDMPCEGHTPSPGEHDVGARTFVSAGRVFVGRRCVHWEVCGGLGALSGGARRKGAMFWQSAPAST